MVVKMSGPSEPKELPTVEELMGDAADGEEGTDGKAQKESRVKKVSPSYPGDDSQEAIFINDLENLVAHGREVFTRKNFDLALRYFRAALALDPDNRIASFFCTKSEYEIQLSKSYDRLFDLTPSIERPRYRPSPDVVTCSNCQGSSQCTYCLGEGKCPSCGGSGLRPNLLTECTVCLGSGICGLCSGTTRCIACNGRSVVYKRGIRTVQD